MARWLGSWAAVAVVVFSFGVAFAEPNRDLEAKRLFEDGSKAFALGDFQRAVDSYRAAYTAKPAPAFLYNIAQAYRLAGNLQQALFFYRSFLSNMPSAPNRREVEKRIVDLDAQLSQQRVLTTAPPNTPVAPNVTTTPETHPDPEPAVAATIARPEPAPRIERQPVHKKWWLWTIVGVAAVGVGVGLGVGLTVGTPKASGPDSHFGTSGVF